MSQSPLKSRANKSLGQHFLTDLNIIEKITSDSRFFEKVDAIIEVGPGPGALTQKLSQKEKPLFLVEMDTRFEESLTQFVTRDHIYFEDALNFDFQNITNGVGKYWLASNLPYNISSQLFIKFLQISQIQFMTLMYQKEVGIKTVTIDQKKSSLLCLSENYFESRILAKVPPGAFSPPPKVNSIIISYERRENPFIKLKQFNDFQSFLRKLFEFKRKKMQSILKRNFSQYNWGEIYRKLKIPDNIRAEDLSFHSIKLLFQETI